jgi:hypothetical protein
MMGSPGMGGMSSPGWVETPTPPGLVGMPPGTTLITREALGDSVLPDGVLPYEVLSPSGERIATAPPDVSQAQPAGSTQTIMGQSVVASRIGSHDFAQPRLHSLHPLTLQCQVSSLLDPVVSPYI